ncbi:hypothetical protein SPSPH_045480 [Sporomusa sphaeroides DSM 2875]|uniref:Rubrerythrin-like domain-containing protein n=1 Tax=Sporomusa sphaeroides DSM 2875 TaxID=1337886 RepID=A0ABP2C4N2_9FIRM|nr:hypothetical protein SPSPH_27740 [Sporomusa sphaeroides DSM 2875]CVK18476.1 hypothetical protein SSPH_01114 [Sporomusa sphaeroides DSM 2875]
MIKYPHTTEANSMPTPLCHGCQHFEADPHNKPCAECRGLYPKSSKNFYSKKNGW